MCFHVYRQSYCWLWQRGSPRALDIIQFVVHVSYISRCSFFAIYMNCEKEICTTWKALTLTPSLFFLTRWESVRSVVLGVQSLDRLINDSN